MSKLCSLSVCALLLTLGLVGAGALGCAPGPSATAAPAASRSGASATPTPAVLAASATAGPTVQPTAAAQGAPAADAPSATAASTPPSQGATKVPGRMVLGYYVPYDATSWASFQARAGSLDYVAAQWVSVDACGNVGSRDDRTLIAYANQHGVKVLPSLLTSTGPLNHQLLTDPATTDRFLTQIVGYVEEMGYPGIDLDLEGIDAGDRDAYSDLVARAAGALHERGKILTLAIPAKGSDVRTGWAGPYDYAALGKSADKILLMTYDYSWPGGPPGSIAPQAWVDKVAAYASSQMPAEKLLIGLAFYGYDWNTTLGGRAKALLYPQAVALAKQHDTQIETDNATRSATFSYTAKAGDSTPPPPAVPALQHDIAVRAPGQCSKGAPPPQPAPPVPTPRAAPPTPGTQEHVVWLEDATSAAGKLEIATRYGLGGVGAWRLGQEDPGVWQQLAGYRSGK